MAEPRRNPRPLRLVVGAAAAASRPLPPPPPPSNPQPAFDDTELLSAIRSGDSSAATSLYRRARPHVDQTIINLLGRGDPDHDDLVQVAMIELVRSLSSFRGECSLNTWTSRVTAHAVYKELRKRRSGGRLLASAREIVRASSSSRSIDLEHEVSMRGTIGQLQRHLDSLDSVKAWTLVLHDVCGYDLREIAQITEASVAAAQSRLVRGRAELHALIENDPELRNTLERGGPGGEEP